MDGFWLIVEGAPESLPLALRLPEGDLAVGRSGDCHVVIPERKVSRRHVVLTRRGDAVSFRDQNSAQGTYLNGQKADQGPLRPGDRLTVGSWNLRLADVPPSATDEVPPTGLAKGAPAPAGLAGAPIVGSPFAGVPLAAAPAGGAAGKAPGGASSSGGLVPLRPFLDQLRRSTDPKTLLERLLLGLVEHLHGERGFVLLREHAGERLVPVACHRIDQTDQLLAVSSTVYNQALETHAIVFIQDSLQNPLCASAQSLVDADARSILCAPLQAAGQSFGVVYVDWPTVGASVTQHHVEVFEIATGLAACLLAEGETRQNLLEARGRIEALNTLAWEGEQLVTGEGPASRELQTLMQAAASQNVTVLLTGETGTGKEMVARWLHRQSPRRDGPFVPVNCAALPRDLIEAELFGAEKGAFTGATERRVGRFELAAGGTLFLDEIGELPLEIQVKLLRVLEERSITRLGGQRKVQLDLRLVCATNRDMEACIKDGTFRQDLYYRVNVFRLQLLPLRQRPEDVLPLARHFIDYFAKKFGRKVRGFAPDAERLVRGYPWPGNIRELKNAVERAVVVEQTDLIQVASLPVAPPGGSSGRDAEGTLWEVLPDGYEDARELFERTFLKRCLATNNGSVTAAAKATGMTRCAIYRRLEKLGITPRD